MDINIMHGDGSIRMEISGDIDEDGAAEMKQRFEQLDLTGVTQAIFDLQRVTYIGSAGLGKLLLFYKKLSTNDVTMKVESPSGMVRDTLTELKLDALFAVA